MCRLNSWPLVHVSTFYFISDLRITNKGAALSPRTAMTKPDVFIGLYNNDDIQWIWEAMLNDKKV
jgi:hypothetical protein